MYEITDWIKKQAKRLGYKVKASTNPKKKIDVFKDDKKVGSVGSKNYGDYGTYLKTKGKEAHFFPDTEAILDFMAGAAKPGDLILVMSNGGFDNIHERLLECL